MKAAVRTCCTLLFAVLVQSAPAWAAKVKVCHVPPGNPANFHTITISENALQAHLGHGDLAGACSASCSQLCDDGDACTIDACDASERCIVTHPPVNCDDGRLCTDDACNPATGCSNTPRTCLDNNLCTVDSCDPMTGQCVFPANSCDAGQTCNPANGNCEGQANACPCQGHPAWDAVLAETDSECVDREDAFFVKGSTGSATVSIERNICGARSDNTGEEFELSITQQQLEACLELVRAHCGGST